MALESTSISGVDWRRELPALVSRSVLLREPAMADVGRLVDLFAIADASRFGLEYPVSEAAVRHFVQTAQRDRAAGVAFTYAVVLGSTTPFSGLVQVRQIAGSFEAGECQAMLVPSSRGTGVFVEVAFWSVGAFRLEARVPLQDGRANGALRKLGAVREGVLRRSLRHGGEYLDQALWSLLRDDWTDRSPSPVPRVH
jgi:RimJ/RimL family protein N-acetyltransferase